MRVAMLLSVFFASTVSASATVLSYSHELIFVGDSFGFLEIDETVCVPHADGEDCQSVSSTSFGYVGRENVYGFEGGTFSHLVPGDKVQLSFSMKPQGGAEFVMLDCKLGSFNCKGNPDFAKPPSAGGGWSHTSGGEAEFIFDIKGLLAPGGWVSYDNQDANIWGSASDEFNSYLARDYAASFKVAHVPVPPSMAFLIAGIGGLGWLRRRQRIAAKTA